MKYIRTFEFHPSWESYGYSWQSEDDKYEVPPFNYIAELLEKKGWEIKEFKFNPCLNQYYKSGMQYLYIIAVKREKPKVNETYYYTMDKSLLGFNRFDFANKHCEHRK